MGKVAVIMSVYKNDRLDYLKLAVDSILSQEGVEFCLYICVDGELSNCSSLYINEIENLNCIKVYHSSVNKGLAVSLNYLIDKVLDDDDIQFIARMDADDISLPERLYKQVQHLSNHTEIDVCGTFCREFGATYALDEKILPVTNDALRAFSVTRCPFIHPSVMFRRSVFIDKKARYPTDTCLTEDMAFWFYLIRNDYVLSNINEVLILYRINEDTILRRKGVLKGFHEFRIRMYNMFVLRRVTFKNILLVFSRLFFHILPGNFLKYLYMNFR